MTFFIILAFLLTVAVLLAGGISMVHGGRFDWAHAGEFMQGRVAIQAVALALIVVATLFWS